MQMTKSPIQKSHSLYRRQSLVTKSSPIDVQEKSLLFAYEYAQKKHKRVDVHEELIIITDDDNSDDTSPPNPAWEHGTYAEQVHYQKFMKQHKASGETAAKKSLSEPMKVDTTISTDLAANPTKHCWELSTTEWEASRKRTPSVSGASSTSNSSSRSATPVSTTSRSSLPSDEASRARPSAEKATVLDKGNAVSYKSDNDTPMVHAVDEVPKSMNHHETPSVRQDHISPLPPASNEEKASSSYSNSSARLISSAEDQRPHQSIDKRRLLQQLPTQELPPPRQTINHESSSLSCGVSPQFQPISRGFVPSQIPETRSSTPYDDTRKLPMPMQRDDSSRPSLMILPSSNSISVTVPTKPEWKEKDAAVYNEASRGDYIDEGRRWGSKFAENMNIVVKQDPRYQTPIPLTRLEQRRAAQLSSERNTKPLSSLGQSSGLEYAWDNQVQYMNALSEDVSW